eukprot:TRINITY_DN25339_c0_g1_i1.p1 TRINITY_DN25339_c0_g1~~TRINITY_DN25339_c0_g1_i1.p1  ORF type:complete len:600 (+),score=181.73 TRINITY_DN25339_c0_g1_i1:54-1802(+)
MPAQACFLNLSNDTLLSIARHLTFYERYEYLRTHRRVWRLLSTHLPRSINICNTPPKRAASVLRWMRDTCRSVRYVNLHGCTAAVDTILPEMLASCTQIEVLNIQHCPAVNDGVLDAIAEHIPKTLRQLGLWDAGARPTGRPGARDETQLSKAALLNLFRKCTRLEVVDLRGQTQIDDEVLEEMGEHLTALRKVALSGTSVTGHGYTKLISQRVKTIQRIGCFNLRPRQDHTPPLLIAAPEMEELQCGHSCVPLLVDIEAMPKLKFLGVSRLRDITVVDWHAAAASSITQITADYYVSYPEAFLDCLETLAPKLQHLSVLSNLHQPAWAGIFPRLNQLGQLAVLNPTCEQLAMIAALPELQYLKVDGLQGDELEAFVASCTAEEGGVRTLHDHAAATYFQRLTNLSLSLADEDLEGEEGECTASVAVLMRMMPRLEGFYLIASLSTCSAAVVLAEIPPLQARYLSLSEYDAATLDVVKRMRNLVRLSLGSIETATPELAAVVASLPDLVVAGPVRWLVDTVFQSWMSFSPPTATAGAAAAPERWLRQHDPYGYTEATAMKPFDQFVGFLEECEDPIYPTMEP